MREYAPEVLVLAPDLAPARALGEVGVLAGLPGWWALPAVKSGRVFLADGALFTRAGPRVVHAHAPSPQLGVPLVKSYLKAWYWREGCGQLRGHKLRSRASVCNAGHPIHNVHQCMSLSHGSSVRLASAEQATSPHPSAP